MWVALAGCAAACQTWAPLDEHAAAALPTLPAAVAHDGTVEIATPGLQGLFTARLVARCEDPPLVRLQLFPDLGGKVLDLAVDRATVRGVIPHAGVQVTQPIPALARTDLLTFVALTLRAEFTPLVAARIEGMRREGDELQLRTHDGDSGCAVVHVLRAGGIVRRELSWRGLHWSIVREAAGDWRIESPEGSWRIQTRGQPTKPPPDELFRPDLR